MYKIDYKYFNCIVKIELTGLISVNEVLDLAKELSNNVKGNNTLYLSDTRMAEYNWDIHEIKLLKDNLSSIVNHEKVNYEAVLVNDPETHVLTTLFHEEWIGNSHFKKVFTTKAAAIKWLLNFK
ncbi:hypothetical protein [Lutibacter flavus]|uniref:SpoIIAA-like n=1 Tax=Lutibacter flavus TaxID=691689 RepID=A0A238VY78_9FLAO|nr:hypothetical protein [Lutibacter flavus]SNR39262.1 hypothetical protein SAMN04488111_1184 [Lutibacter flavus]